MLLKLIYLALQCDKETELIKMAFKLPRRKYFPVIFVIAVLVVFAAWCQFEKSHRDEKSHPELLLTGLGAIGGFAYFLYRQHLDETRLFKELFAEFNARYDKLNNDLNKILDGPEQGLPSTMERDTVFKYFNLCAEEYLFHKAGYIDKKVWNAWQKGMVIFFKNPRIAALWKSEEKTDSYYGFHPPSLD